MANIFSSVGSSFDLICYDNYNNTMMFFHMMVTGKKVRQFNIDFLNVNCVYSSLAETYIAEDIKYWKVGNSSYIHMNIQIDKTFDTCSCFATGLF